MSMSSPSPSPSSSSSISQADIDSGFTTPTHLIHSASSVKYKTILYHIDPLRPFCFITLNRPHKLNAILSPMHVEISHAIQSANANRHVKVIILRGNGSSFCAGFDFDNTQKLQYFPSECGSDMNQWDAGRDFMLTTSKNIGPIPNFMSIWHSQKPVICQLHGYVMGGGSDMALMADIIIAADDTVIGTPYSRVWGASLSGMWLYRLGLTRCKEISLLGSALTGKEAQDISLVNRSVPFAQLENEVRRMAIALASIPSTQLSAMKTMMNQTFDNMGLESTQRLGAALDGAMRHTKEAQEWIAVAQNSIQEAVKQRDEPFQDYSQGETHRKPNLKEHKFQYNENTEFADENNNNLNNINLNTRSSSSTQSPSASLRAKL